MKLLRSLPSRVAILAIFALAAFPCFAGEMAVLKNGFSIRHERREVVGDITRLYTTADGASFVDVPTASIEHYEPAPDLGPSASEARARVTPHPAPAGSQPSSLLSLNDVVNQASGRYRLDPDFVNSVIKAESGFNVRAVSPKGAQGLMQLMPGTASQLGVPNAFDPQANVEGGTKYLRELLERYNFDMVKALAAYNAGPQRVERFGGVPPYYETHAYIARIIRDFNKKKIAEEKAAKTSTAKAPIKQSPRKPTSQAASTKTRTAKPTTEANLAAPNSNH